MYNPDSFVSVYPVKILVSDPKANARTETINLLKTYGYMPDEAVSEEALLSLAEKGGYDVILMNFRISAANREENIPESPTQSRPLLIGISPSAKLDFSLPKCRAGSDLLISRPTTTEELLDQLKCCSLLPGKCNSYKLK